MTLIKQIISVATARWPSEGRLTASVNVGISNPRSMATSEIRGDGVRFSTKADSLILRPPPWGS